MTLVPIELQRDERAGEVAVFTAGDALGVRAWIDLDGACRIGGVGGVQVRVGPWVLGLELLGARTIGERLGRPAGVRYLVGGLVRLRTQRFPGASGWPRVDRRTAEALTRAMEGLLCDLSGEPVGPERLVREVLADGAPWAAARVDDEPAGLRVRVRLPRALGPLRPLAVDGIRRILEEFAPLRVRVQEAERT